MMQSRTHNCGELRLNDAGKTVKIVGWMENIRVVSAALAFVVVALNYVFCKLFIFKK